MSQTFIEKFWQRVDKNGPVPEHCPDLGPCWLWTGSRNPKGYGEVRRPGNGKRRRAGAHRVAYELEHGPIPDELLVLHKCDNPPCVRHGHLYAGSAKQNADDMVSRGREKRFGGEPAFRGERNPRSVLTSELVLKIRRLHDGGLGSDKIAAELGLKYQTVYAVVKRRNWKHIPEER